MERGYAANPPEEDCVVVGTAPYQGSLLRACEASEANSTTKATSNDLFENVCPDRCAETRGYRGSFSFLGSEKWSQYSLPWSTLFAPFPGGSSSAKGTPLKTIGDVLGHGSARSTSTYLRLATEDLREVPLPVPGRGRQAKERQR